MSLGNGAPRGVPLAQDISVLKDPRTYYRAWTAGAGAGGNTDENPIAPPTHNGRMSAYAKAVAATPGLMMWWRFDKLLSSATVGGGSGSAANFANSVGPTTLRGQGAGVPKLATGLVPAENGVACDLNGGYLDGFDYRAITASGEVQSVELWVYFRSLKTDVGIVSYWLSNSGWMLYTSNGTTLSLYDRNVHLDAVGALSTGLHHIVGVWGGDQGPTPDYYSRLYVDGKEVANGLTVPTGGSLITTSVRFEIGNYANGGGTNNLDGIVDEVAIYSRMLQPEEVRQHYKAAFTRL